MSVFRSTTWWQYIPKCLHCFSFKGTWPSTSKCLHCFSFKGTWTLTYGGQTIIVVTWSVWRHAQTCRVQCGEFINIWALLGILTPYILNYVYICCRRHEIYSLPLYFVNMFHFLVLALFSYFNFFCFCSFIIIIFYWF